MGSNKLHSLIKEGKKTMNKKLDDGALLSHFQSHKNSQWKSDKIVRKRLKITDESRSFVLITTLKKTVVL